MASSPVGSPLSLLYGGDLPELRATTLPAAIEMAARAGASLRMLAGEREPTELSYAALLDRSVQAAAGLQRLGVRRGDRVVIMLPTGEGWIATFFGTLLAGGVPVPVAPVPVFGAVERTLATVRHIIQDSGADVLVTDKRTSAHRAALLAGAQSLSAVVEPPDLVPAPGQRALFPTPDPEDTGLLQYTSGTTEAPKGVALSHRALLTNAFGIGERLGMTPNDVGVSWLPLFHDMGLIGTLLTSVVWHYPIGLMPTESFLVHPHRWLQAIGRTRATLSVAPNFAYRLAQARIEPRHLEGVSLASWRAALSGSEAVEVSTVRAFAHKFSAWGYDERATMAVYGLAENCLAVTFPPAGEALRAVDLDRHALETERAVAPARDGRPSAAIVSVGTPLVGQRVAVRGDDGALLDEGIVGEIVVGGACLMKGYHQNEAATAETLRDGWLHTGDLGFVRDGRLHVTGRAKELIIRRGRNYYPYDIERAAAGVAGAGAAAFGCPNEESGTEDLVVIVECKERDAGVQEDLKKKIHAEVLAAVGIAAERIVLCPSRSLPRTTSGKLQRALARRRWLDGSLPVTG
jgi:acyl-CoA synthetase (AMP-forming)/AMP-acid ligase II